MGHDNYISNIHSITEVSDSFRKSALSFPFICNFDPHTSFDHLQTVDISEVDLSTLSLPWTSSHYPGLSIPALVRTLTALVYHATPLPRVRAARGYLLLLAAPHAPTSRLFEHLALEGVLRLCSEAARASRSARRHDATHDPDDEEILLFPSTAASVTNQDEQNQSQANKTSTNLVSASCIAPLLHLFHNVLVRIPVSDVESARDMVDLLLDIAAAAGGTPGVLPALFPCLSALVTTHPTDLLTPTYHGLSGLIQLAAQRGATSSTAAAAATTTATTKTVKKRGQATGATTEGTEDEEARYTPPSRDGPQTSHAALRFGLDLATRLPQARLHLISLAKHLCLTVVDRVEPRITAAKAVVTLVQALPGRDRVQMVDFLYRLASSRLVPQRLMALELAEAFLVGFEETFGSASVTITPTPITKLGTTISTPPTPYSSIRKAFANDDGGVDDGEEEIGTNLDPAPPSFSFPRTVGGGANPPPGTPRTPLMSQKRGRVPGLASVGSRCLAILRARAADKVPSVRARALTHLAVVLDHLVQMEADVVVRGLADTYLALEATTAATTTTTATTIAPVGTSRHNSPFHVARTPPRDHVMELAHAQHMLLDLQTLCRARIYDDKGSTRRAAVKAFGALFALSLEDCPVVTPTTADLTALDRASRDPLVTVRRAALAVLVRLGTTTAPVTATVVLSAVLRASTDVETTVVADVEEAVKQLLLIPEPQECLLAALAGLGVDLQRACYALILRLGMEKRLGVKATTLLAGHRDKWEQQERNAPEGVANKEKGQNRELDLATTRGRWVLMGHLFAVAAREQETKSNTKSKAVRGSDQIAAATFLLHQWRAHLAENTVGKGTQEAVSLEVAILGAVTAAAAHPPLAVALTDVGMADDLLQRVVPESSKGHGAAVDANTMIEDNRADCIVGAGVDPTDTTTSGRTIIAPAVLSARLHCLLQLSPVANWGSTLLLRAETTIRTGIDTLTASLDTDYNTSTNTDITWASLDAWLFLVGEVVLSFASPTPTVENPKGSTHGPHRVATSMTAPFTPPPRLGTLVQGLASSTLLCPDGQGTVSVPPRTQAFAWAAVGKLALGDESLAKQIVPLMVQQLRHSPHPAVRNNLSLTLADLCVRHTAVVDGHVPALVASVRDPSEIVRRQTLALLAHLLLADYVKGRGILYQQLVLSLTDPSPRVRAIADYLIRKTLAERLPLLAYNHFFELLFIMNGAKHLLDDDAELMVLKPSEGSCSSKWSFSTPITDATGVRNEEARRYAYRTLLRGMTPENKFQTCARLVDAVLVRFAEGDEDLEVENVTGVLSDVFWVLTAPEAQVTTTSTTTISDNRNDNMEMAAAAVKMQLLPQLMVKYGQETLMPALGRLKGRMELVRHRLSQSVVTTAALLARLWKVEVADLVTTDRHFAAEVQFAWKRLEGGETGAVVVEGKHQKTTGTTAKNTIASTTCTAVATTTPVRTRAPLPSTVVSLPKTPGMMLFTPSARPRSATPPARMSTDPAASVRNADDRSTPLAREVLAEVLTARRQLKEARSTVVKRRRVGGEVRGVEKVSEDGSVRRLMMSGGALRTPAPRTKSRTAKQ